MRSRELQRLAELSERFGLSDRQAVWVSGYVSHHWKIAGPLIKADHSLAPGSLSGLVMDVRGELGLDGFTAARLVGVVTKLVAPWGVRWIDMAAEQLAREEDPVPK